MCLNPTLYYYGVGFFIYFFTLDDIIQIWGNNTHVCKGGYYMLKAVKKSLVLLCVLMSLECVVTTVFAEELTGEATGERMIQSGVSEEVDYSEFVIKDGVLEAYNGTDNDVVIPEGVKEIASCIL